MKVIQYPFEAGGVVTRAIEFGAGADVVLCLHGAGSRADRWRPAAQVLAATGRRVVAVDFPGHGFAAKDPSYPYSAPEFSTFVADVVDTLELGRVHILGTSLGAHVGAMVACRRPETVRSLVMIGAVGLVEFPAELMRDPGLLCETSPEAIRRKLSVLVEDPALVTDLWVREESMINSSPGANESLRVVGEYLNEGLNRDLIGDRLARIDPQPPMLLVWGADDEWVTPDHGEASQQVLGGVELVLMDGCGHAPYFEQPERFVEIVDGFLARAASDVASQSG